MAELSDIQKELLELVKLFHSLCVENHIDYSLHGGTLLGAIRNKGFISWDDDIDISLTRENFEKLKAVINSSNNQSGLVFLQLSQAAQISFKNNKKSVWIDVLIYDYVSEKKWAQNLKICLLIMSIPFCRRWGTLSLRKTINHYSLFCRIAYDLVYCIGNLVPYKTRLKWRDDFSKKHLCGNKTLILKSNDQAKGIREILPKSIMSEYRIIQFEDTELMISEEYKKMLIIAYGENYMTPIQYGYDEKKAHDNMRKFVI